MRSLGILHLGLFVTLILQACQPGDSSMAGGASEATFGLARGTELDQLLNCTLQSKPAI